MIALRAFATLCIGGTGGVMGTTAGPMTMASETSEEMDNSDKWFIDQHE